MDVKYINPFIEAFFNIMPQIGFSEVKKQSLGIKTNVKSTGIVISLGIIGDVKGNIVYSMDMESGKRIASKMMMGFPVVELNEMAQSAISELSNMLTANASTNFSNIGVNMNISTPTLIYGEEVQIKTNTDTIISVKMTADGIPVDINVALDNV